MSEPLLLSSDEKGVRTLTLNSPDTLNALSHAMLDALTEELESLYDNRDVRVVVIKGAGRAFCAGHNLRELTEARQAEDGGLEGLNALFKKCSHMMTTLPKLPQPVIAQVHGIAAAAGCQLVASCDMAVAAESARFGVNGVNIGLFCSTPMVAVTRVMPRKKAFELLTTGEFIDAPRAEELGLINRVASEEGLEAATRDLAETIAGKLSSAIRIGKVAFYEQIDLNLADAYAYTGEVIVKNMMNEDTTEGVKAFLEKRPPNWDN
ncbi:MAG: enoyl-CoA hydratase [Rhodobacteraceae bacterium]|nr:enoyl-CoA hydratase [Paracoccaceae bacterium]